MAVLAALLVIMTVTPLGYIPVGPLAATTNMIPVAIGSILLGPGGGAALGLVFGLTSFANAAGVLGAPSALGTALMAVNPFLTFVVCVIPRVLEGILAGLLSRGLWKTKTNKAASCGIVGFATAALNTIFFMTALVLCFTPILKESGCWAEGQNVFAFVAAFVGFNALLELAVSAVITSVVGFALYKAGLTTTEFKKAKAAA